MSSEKKNRKISVSHKMFSTSVVTMVVMIAVFGIVSLVFAKLKTETDSYNNMVNAGTVISGIVSDYMNPKITAVSDIARDEGVKSYIGALGVESSFENIKSADGYPALQKLLNKIAASDNDIISAWIISERSGSVIADNERCIVPEDFSLTGRYWYNNSALSSGVLCVGEEAGLFDKETEAITVISPIYTEEGAIGFAGIEIDISGLCRIMEQYTLNSGCYPIICCNYGSVIYAPSSTAFVNRFDVNKAPLVNVIIQANSYSGIDSYSEGIGINNTVYFNVDNLSVPGWSIVVVFDSEIMNGGIYNFLLVEIVILICLVILSLIILRNKIIKETALISQVSDTVRAVAEGNYKHNETDYSVRNELTDSVENLNRIAEAMNEKTEIIREYTSNDILTGLPNRMSMYEKIETLIERYSSENGSGGNRFALMFVDVDNFKWLNENLGHNFGDTVLCTFANVLSSTLSKIGMVYRFGGDEFIILVEFGSDYEKIHKVINKLQNAFSRQMQVITENIYLKFSMGVSIFPDDDVTADMLLRDADLALHRAKESGKDRVSFYTNTAKRQNFSKAAIAQQISTALKDGEMYLNFQPIVSTENGDIHGFEVLLRWQSSVFGNISPSEFITVAEETGAIVQIGMWIFESSCRFLKELCEKYRDDIIMSINVSPIQLKRADYIENVKRVIEITQVNPKNIQLEITESTLIDFIDNDNSVIEQINDMGIAIALDDFGTGYSSLNYLKNFPIKCLKIDKSFVDEINNNKRDYAITDSIIDLVHNLGIKTVAEGIETVGQYNFLCEMKCDFIQGFLMSKPLDENSALEFVKMYDALHKPDSAVLAEHEKQLADEKLHNAKEDGDGNNGGNDDPILVDEFISK